MNIKDYIRVVPDFPKPGINFYDIASLLASPNAWKETVKQMQAIALTYKPDVILGIEARGFLVATPLAMNMNLQMGMVRKKGKLPGTVLSHSYTLEYGQDTIEIQPDLLPEDARILLIDDLMATGGTMSAAETLVENAGAVVVGGLCVIELDGLDGRAKLKAPFSSLIRCPA